MTDPGTVSQGAEQLAIEYWIYNTLTTDTTLAGLMPDGVDIKTQVHEAEAPATLPYPLIVFQFVTGKDVPTIGGPGRLISRNLYQVVAMFEKNVTKNIQPIVNQIDQLMITNLALQTITLSDDTVWTARIGSYRDAPISFTENNKGRRIFHKGGQYWIDCQESQVSS